jgi:hypothetical protein
MKHELLFNDKLNTFFLRLVDEITPEDYIAINEFYKTLKEPKPQKVLIDITRTKMTTWKAWDRKTRDKVNASILPFPSGTRVAVVGATPVSRMVLKVALGVYKAIKTSRFFKTEDEALGWLGKED